MDNNGFASAGSRRCNAFSKAFGKQNDHYQKAIQSLDSLNDQIVQFIFTPKSTEFDVCSDSYNDPQTAVRCQQQREALKSSMALMRRLLVDAQAKFRKMMEDNKVLASRIDGDIQNAHEEVSMLRAELENTNKKIAEMTSSGKLATVTSTASVMAGHVQSPCDAVSKGNLTVTNQSGLNCCNIQNQNVPLLPSSNCPIKFSPTSIERDIDKQSSPHSLVKDNDVTPNNAACERCKNCTHEDINQLEERLCQQEELNYKLSQQNRCLQRELEELRPYKENTHAQEFELHPEKERLETELHHAKEALGALKQDRKRLKMEKFDLLNQMKQLYSTLEDKEKELRDFIRNYEQRMKESDENLKQLVRSREESEREKWNIVKHARDEAERSLALCAQLGLKDAHIRQLQEELNMFRDRMGYSSDVDSCRYGRTNGYQSPNMVSTGHAMNGRDSGNAPTPTPPSSSFGTPAITVNEDQNSIYCCGSSDQRSSWSPQSSLCASPLTEDSYNEKLKLLEEAQETPMEKWKAATVLSWLEVSLGMPQYGSKCAENIKSGKVLLELSDEEMEVGLGITNAMHRRKLRLAIEEHRDPSSCLNPKINLLSHIWMVEEWLPSLGLSMYSEAFKFQLMDGRVLDTLTKKDLEKYLNVSRKFHQTSLMHAIHLLRIVKFDKQVLEQRRSRSEHMDLDPLVWTNQRFIKWVQSIDLVEYAENLKDSGVHGALIVLELSFTADTMATALGIPTSKNIIRRHLKTELDNLIQPARMSLEAKTVFHTVKSQKKNTGTSVVSGTGSLGRSFMRSSLRGTFDRRRTSMRSSTRALDLNTLQDLHQSTNFQYSLPMSKQANGCGHVKLQGRVEAFTVTPV
ncbi:kazrin-like isoform X5 [Tachypleus tridentatus]|uniref:kazrin-like isoform X5 n=1 Tax=Tachypleus tridentatus TaxID=6853 RepID=UPI003FD41442